MTISILRLYSRRSVLSYQRRFPVVYLIWWAMRRPRLVSKQLEVCAFCVTLYISQNSHWIDLSDLFGLLRLLDL